MELENAPSGKAKLDTGPISPENTLYLPLQRFKIKFALILCDSIVILFSAPEVAAAPAAEAAAEVRLLIVLLC